MALTNDFKVKNGLTVTDSISAGGNLSASDGFFDGDVGIGMSSPSRKLDISTSSSTDAVRIKNTDNNGGGLSVFAANSGISHRGIQANRGYR